MPSHDATIDAGEALLDVGRVDDARQRAADVLAEAPDNVDAWCLMARCHETAGDYEAMLTAASEGASVAPDEARPHMLRGLALIQLDRTAEAAEAGAEAVRAAPEHWFAHLVHGLALIDLPGQRRAGWAEIQLASALAPEEPYAHFVQGIVHQSRGRNRSARRAFARALELDPEYADALNSLGQVAFREGFLASAGRYFGSAAGHAPTDPAAAANLTRVLHGALGWAIMTAWCAAFVLMFAMFPVAWAIAAAIVLAGGWWLCRIWRALPAGGRALARHQIATDPRSRVRVVLTGVSALLAVVLGVSSTIAGTSAGAGYALSAFGSLLAVLIVGAIVIVVTDARGARPGPDEPEPEVPFDEIVERQTGLLAWRWYRAACLPAGVLWFMVVGEFSWQARAITGTVILVAYGLAARLIQRRVRNRVGPPPPAILGRATTALNLGWFALVAYMVAASYLPSVPDVMSAFAFVFVGGTAIGYLVWLPIWLVRKLARLVSGRPSRVGVVLEQQGGNG